MSWVSTVDVESLQPGDRVLEVFWRGGHAFEEPGTVLNIHITGETVTFRVWRDGASPPLSSRDELTVQRRVGEWAKRLIS